MKRDLKERAVLLRKKGYSYNLIREEVLVSKSTLTLWLKDVPYQPNEAVKNRIKGAVLKAFQWQQKRKEKSIQIAREYARKTLRSLSKRDLLLLGIGLYIGEGTKTANHVGIVNSDPGVICLGMRWLEETFGLTIDNFSLAVHLYPDNDVEKSLEFWQKVTGIPRSQFHKTQIDTRVKQLKKHGMLRHGTVRLSIRNAKKQGGSTFLSRKILALLDEVVRQNN